MATVNVTTNPGDVVVVNGSVVHVEPEAPKQDKLFVKLYSNGKVTAFRTQEDADANKTSPRASRRLIIDLSDVEDEHGWQEFAL